MAKAHFRLVPYRLWPGINWFLIALTLALAVCGVVTLWGATSDGQGPGPLRGFALKQAVFFGLGFVLMAALIVLTWAASLFSPPSRARSF
jgi:cell division protein FtsW (lipid II flippase)